MKHCRPKRPGDTTGAGRVWTDQGLARNRGDQPTCVLVAGHTVGSGNKGIAEAERSRSTAGRSIWLIMKLWFPAYCNLWLYGLFLQYQASQKLRREIGTIRPTDCAKLRI
jgi:hypothetical protein